MRALGVVGVAPEVVAPLLQLEGVVGSAVRAPDVQVAVPEDTDAYSTALHTAHHCSMGSWAQTLPESSQNPPHTHQQCQVLKVPSSSSHEVPNAEHRAVGAGEGIISAVLEIGVVPGLQGIGPERDQGRKGQDRLVIRRAWGL